MIALLPDIIEAGFDILNPVQCSAAGMDAANAQGTLWVEDHLLGRRRGYAEDPALRHACRSPA